MAEFFTRPNFDNRQIVQRVGDSINLSGTTTIANPGYLKINEGAAPGLVATSLDFDGTVIWGPVSGLSWSISACTSPLYVNNIVACPSSAGTIVVESGVLSINGALQLNTVFSGGTASDRLLVVDSNGFVKVGQTGTSISSLSYSNNNLILTLNDGSIFTATINTMTGLTVNGNLTVSGNTSIVGGLNVTGDTYVSGAVSATTFYGSGANLTGIPDYYVTGGTFTGNILTLNRQNGFVTIAGFTGFTDNYVTGGTYNYGTGTLTLNRQNGSVNINGIQFTGNTLASCINDIYVQNLYGCSNPITIQSSLKSSAGGSTATGTLAFAFGNNVTATGNYSMAQGNGTSTVGGTYAHAEGFNTLASGQGSHAEGIGSIASGNYSHAQGLFTIATTEGTFASGSGSTASGANSFVHSVGSTVSGNRSVVLGGFGINGTANDFVYVPSLNINTAPANNNSNTQILSRNSGTGNVEYTDSSFLTIDTFVTGFTFTNNNTLTIGRNQGLPPLPVTINNLILTGLTVNGSISATTYLNLPPFITGFTDNFVTGGTFSSGTLTLNRQNGIVTVTGFSTTDTFVTGYTFTNDNTLTIGRNQGLPPLPVTINNLILTGLTVNGSISATTYLNLPPFITGFTDNFVTGGTFSSGTLTLNRQNGIVTVTGFSTTDTFVTGYTFTNDNTLTIGRNQGQSPLNVTINNLFLTGLTVAGAVSAATYLGLPQFVTGGTYSAGTLSLLTNYGNSVNLNITGFTDTFTTGFTYSNNNLTISRNQGQPPLNVTIDNFTGLTVNGSLSASTYLNLPQFVTGGTYSAGTLSLLTNYGNSVNLNITGFSTTDTFVTGFTYSNNNLSINQNQGQSPLNVTINNFTGLTINGSLSASTYLNLPAFITGFTDTFVTGFTFTNSNTLNITQNNGQTVPAVTINNLFLTGLTVAGAVSAATYLNLPPFTGNTSASCITDLYVSNIYGCSPITIHDSIQSVGSTASGLLSTALGSSTQAIGDYSHSEGSSTTAEGDYSHSEGDGTQSIGVSSHAEGGNTQAIGFYSHAEGRNSIAIGDYSHVEGNGIVSGAYAYLVSGTSGNDIVLNPSYGDVRSEFFSSIVFVYDSGGGGEVLNFSATSYNNITSATTVVVNSIGLTTPYYILPNPYQTGVYNPLNADQILGEGSHAEGFGTQAIGPYSHVEGQSTQAIGYASHVEGQSTQAIGYASHAEGLFTQSIGQYSHSQGVSTIASGDYSFASGSASTASGIASFVHSSNSIVTGDRSVVLGGQGISGTSNDFVYVSNLNINSTPVSNPGATEFLVRNPGTGDIEYRNVSTISGGTGIDTFTTGFTFTNNNTLTIDRNQGLPPLPVTINNLTLTGLTVNGAISASTYLNLPQFVTGGTYSAGTLSLLTNYGNSVNLNITGFSTTDTFVTGFTYNNSNKLTLSQNQGQPDLNIYINVMSGLTINGSLAQGLNTTASGQYSHSEGISTSATTTGAHSQGNKTIASGLYSFASGSGSTASGDASFVHSNDSTVSGDRSVVLGGQGISGTSNDFVYVPSLNIDTIPVNDDTNTKVLVRNTSTGNVETKTFGLDNIVLIMPPPAIPRAGVGPPVTPLIKGIPQGQKISGYTDIYVNNVPQVVNPSSVVTTNFGTYNNATGLFTTNVDATLMLNAFIHLKPDTSTSTAWSLSGTGEFGLGICPITETDIYVGNYQTIIPDPDTAQYVYELYGANAPRTNQIDISTSTVVYAISGATFRVKVFNKTDRNYAGSPTVSGDGIRFSITRIM